MKKNLVVEEVVQETSRVSISKLCRLSLEHLSCRITMR